ncbi:MAG: cytidine deaminase [Lachnospiraceae bacterium]|nr:cytidine deaminase [Lachnospiraceae bacterium]MBQ8879127.1 cytidine deaminase [Lachnospiraceae bacterium]
MPVKELILSALEARKKAYTPYSEFKVGAAVLTAELRIYTGCNIENAAYSPGICAERTAVYKAISEGCRKIKAIAIVGDKTGDSISQYAFPCGVCRQVMREFSNPEEMIVIVAKSCEEYQLYTLNQLLPESFGPENLI